MFNYEFLFSIRKKRKEKNICNNRKDEKTRKQQI